MSDDQAREMRPETTSEHIARDMREGRFPEQSERQMVPVLASLPHEIQVWLSMDALDHTGTWSTTRYPAEAVTYVSKSDAAAAQALMVERAVAPLTDGEAYSAALGYRHDLGLLPPRDQELECSRARWWHVALSHRIRALTPVDGLAMVQELRAEMDTLAAENASLKAAKAVAG